jgi:hypothetical protein
LGSAAGLLMLESEKTITENTKLAKVVGYKSKALNEEQRASLAETVSSLIIDAVASGGNNIVDIINISLGSAYSFHDGETVLSDMCGKIDYNGTKECVKTNWMGACGIVQVGRALENIDKRNIKNTVWTLINIDREKASVLVLKSV